MSIRQTIFAVANKVGLSAAARRATAGKLRILCFHGLWTTPGYEFGNCTFIAPEQFERRMAQLKRSGLPVLPLGEALTRLKGGSLPEAAVAITIDDGWVSTFTHMLPVLEAHAFPATLYVTTWYAGRELPVVNQVVPYLAEAAGRSPAEALRKTAEIEMLPLGERLAALRDYGTSLDVSEAWLERRQFNIMSAEEIAEAHRRGLDIQLHTHRHIDVTQRVDALPREIEENRSFLAKIVAENSLTHFCYPSGTSHPRAAAILADSGVASATLCEEGLNGRDADPLRLRRFLDGRSVTDAHFDAYLDGVLHYAAPIKALLARQQAQAA